MLHLCSHRKCPYWKLLKHYCPCQVDWRLNKFNGRKIPKPSQLDLLKDHCKVEDLHKFLRACLKRIVPMSFWGHQGNLSCVLGHVWKLINVQMKGEISLNHMINGVKRNKMTWLCQYGHDKQRDVLMRCIDFLIERLICPLIRSFFMVVATTFAKNKLIFFRKRVWQRLYHKALWDFMKFCNLKMISEKEYSKFLQEDKTIGYSQVHFHLKKSSLRSICNLSTTKQGRASINDHLKVLHMVLEFEKCQQPFSFGVTVNGREEIHQRLKNFVFRVRKKKFRRVYFLTADIQNCFDSIDPYMLFILASRVLKSDFYRIYRFRKSMYRKNKIFYRYFESAHDINYIRETKMGDIEVVGSYMVSRDTLLSKLESILHYNVLKIGRRYYVQNKGISQGSIISSLLCGIFLGFVENETPVSLTDDDLFIRQTDDYLISSPSKERIKTFFESLNSKVNEFLCIINPSKCCVNFDYTHPTMGRIKKTIDMHMRFSGIAINCVSLEITSDFSHYEDLGANDVITMKLGPNPGKYVKRCVFRSLYPKCDMVLFDTDINSNSAILLNTLCIFCICAIKFHAYVMWLPKTQRIDKNPAFFLDIVLSLPSVLRNTVESKLKRIGSCDTNRKCDFPLPIEVLCCLCVSAFLHKMSKHQTIYKTIIPKLEEIQRKYPPCDLNFLRRCFQVICLK